MSDVWDYLAKNPPKPLGDGKRSHAEQFFGARDYFSRYWDGTGTKEEVLIKNYFKNKKDRGSLLAGIILEALCMGVINLDEALIFAENNWKKMHGFGTWKCRGGKFLKKKYRKSMWLFKGNLKWSRVMDIYCEKLSDLVDKTYGGTKYEFGVRVWNRKGRKGCYYTFGGGYRTYIMHELSLVCGEEKEIGMKWI